MKLNRPSLLVSALAAALLAASLSACAPLIIGGAAVGAMVTFDRRTSGAQLEDEGIELRSGSRLREALGDRAHVNINSYNRQVLLTGEVPNEQDKQLAEQIVSRVDNVKGVVNDLAVMGNTALSARSNDVLITGKVKASLVDASDLYVGAFKVVTERGVVYLMGRVTQREADKATQITRNIGGVQRVVRIFEILSEEELRRLNPLPQSSRPATAPAAAPAAAPAMVPAPAPLTPAPVTTTSPTTAPSSTSPTALPPLGPASVRR
ncbi:BON domain-containing protein [Ramlibacter sp. WS9]|uniref:BON domain-containing protein n=1 Tax=Ramlibacter sp. WS9 TaxID=1882741 RepID=UPI0011449082|nr:BON domain-containing protein [Ramlibacter sp. WS9]ROZ78681.1 BON domain-containing protein [Ramlibacter sp. WS9]